MRPSPPAGRGDAPLIVTAGLDAQASAHFDELRQRHFPPERNVLAAHVTLFHHLDGDAEAVVRADLVAEAHRQGPFDACVRRLRDLGRGVAYDIDSPTLVALRARLAERWQDQLTDQDRRWRQPHVTVQNKVAPEQARALLEELSVGFVPHDVRVERLVLWRYRGGPWELLDEVPLGPGSGSEQPAIVRPARDGTTLGS